MIVNGCVNVDSNELPIELLSFTAESSSENIVVIKWITASETNNSHFILEKASNNMMWQTIAIINGQGTTTEKNYYNYIDTSPYPNLNYYRLTQYDFDGEYESFRPIVVINNSSRILFTHKIHYNMFGNEIKDILFYHKPFIVVYYNNNTVVKVEKIINL